MTHTPREPKTNGSGMFTEEDLPHYEGVLQFLHAKYRKDLEETCLICPLLKSCDYAIPARPYYDKGLIVLRPRPRIEEHFDLSRFREPVFPEAEIHLNLPFTKPE